MALQNCVTIAGPPRDTSRQILRTVGLKPPSRASKAYWTARGRMNALADTLRMKPPEKARAAFARMRSRCVPEDRLLVNCLAITMAVTEDPVQPGADGGEYRLTQIGKAALRTAGGFRYTRVTRAAERLPQSRHSARSK